MITKVFRLNPTRRMVAMALLVIHTRRSGVVVLLRAIRLMDTTMSSSWQTAVVVARAVIPIPRPYSYPAGILLLITAVVVVAAVAPRR